MPVCWSCKHILYSMADEGYSEYTPGSSFDLDCMKDHWKFDPYVDSLEKFKNCLLTAETCKDFERRD